MKITKLIPAYKSIIWGGNKLKTEYGKATDLSPLAETWELSFHKDGPSLIEDKTPLCEVATDKDIGENCKGFDFFPVLVKFIDAQDKLSVQVHPGDEYALKHENSLGKTEMWYIVDAEEGAGIYLGFKEDISKEDFERAIAEKTLTDYLRFVPVKKGESYFIPSGTIHAICAGCLICEIQQNSNITYRVYDYGRRDKNGNERELHVSKAIDVTNTKAVSSKELDIQTSEGALKGANKFFTANYIDLDGSMAFKEDTGSFRCFTILEGEGRIGDVSAKKGESVFVPANHSDIEVCGKLSAIVTSIRKYYKRVEGLECKIVNDLSDTLAIKNATRDDEIESTLVELMNECGLTNSDFE